MLESIAILLGALAGCGLAFVPGLHVALALSLLMASGLLGVFGPAGAGCFVAGAAGAVLYAKRLGTVYHPTASSEDAASMDPALRLTQAGRGKDCLKLMVFATDMSWIPLVVMVILMLIASAFGVDLAKVATGALGAVCVPVILVWLFYVIKKSKRPWVTLTGLLVTGLVGYCVLHHPALVGNEHQLAPLMSGLFAIPIMWLVLRERHDQGFPEQFPVTPVIECDPGLAVIGSIIGCISGFFAGLGAGSLIGMFSGLTTRDEDYLLLSAAGEAANDSLALLLVLVAGVGRSGEAILLGRATGGGMPQMVPGLVLFLAVAFGAVVGRKFVHAFEDHYLKFLTLVPPAFWAVVVITLALWQVVATGALVPALCLMVAAACVAFWSRANHLPLQVAFGSLALPLLVAKFGMVGLLNHILFV